MILWRGVCLLSALPMLGSFAGGAIKAVATGTKYLNKAETVAKYLTLGTKLVSHTAQATMSGIDTYYAAVDAYEAYQAGELGAEEILNLGLAATGTVLSTGAAISSGRGLYKLMGSDGVGCKVMTGITGEPHCFVAGTSVSTEDGQRAIEEVKAGDKVWAYDEETGEKELKEVEEVFVSETDKLIHVETDREEIVTTELHPFYVEGLGFVQAGCLKEGYELVCLDGSRETIANVRVEWLEEAVEVYNFEVSDYHTYYVGDGDVLVHNKCANSISTTESPALKDSPYNPDVVNERVKPKYIANIAHNNRSSSFNIKKTPKPADALDVYNNAVRGSMADWFGVNSKGEIYQFFSDNAGGVHFAGIISKQDLADKNSSVLKLLGISMKGKR